MAIRRANVLSTAVGAVSTPLTGKGKRVRVENVDGAGYISFRTDGVVAVLNADETFTVPRLAGANREVSVNSAAVTVSHIASVDTRVIIMFVDVGDDE